MKISRSLFLFFTILVAQPGWSQSDYRLKVAVDKNRILIGEVFTLTVDVKVPAGKISLYQPIDTIPHFEFAEPPLIDTIDNNTSITIRGVYKLTSFDSGHWVIPSYKLNVIKTDTIPVDVVFSDFDPSQDYHDIKDIIEVKAAKKKQWWWYVAGGLLLVLALLFYFLRRKKQPVVVAQPIIKTNPFEEAMNALDKLRAPGMEAKQFHSALTSIFRVYIYKRKGILSLQKTTDDLVLQLRDLNLDK